MKEKAFKDMGAFIARTTYRAVREARDAFPTHEAVRYMGRSVSYEAFLPEVDEVAIRYARLGVKKGDCVLFCMPNVPNIVFSVYALHKLGAVVCPVHPQSSAAELEYYLRDTNARFAVCFAPLFPFLAEAKRKLGRELTVVTVAPEETLLFSRAVPPADALPSDVMTWKDFLSLSAPVEIEEAVDPKTLAVIFYSGGTTGTPKGIMLSSENVNALAYQTEDGSGLIPMSDYSMLAVIPMFHGFGFGVNVHLMLALGGTTILIPNFSATDIGETILREKPNIIAGVPTLFYAITMSLAQTDCDLSFLKGAFSGGDSVPQRIKDVFNAFSLSHGSDARLREGYGLTESVTVNCITDFSGGKKGSIGIPLVGNDFSIRDPQTGKELPRGTEGEICLSGPTVMLGYLNRPEETEKALRKENGKIVLHTGDRGYLDEDGYLFFSSRQSRIIVTNGYNVYPADVEGIASSLPAVKQACCIGLSDEVKGQSVCLLVVPKEGAEESGLRNDLSRVFEEKLAAYKRPTLVLFRSVLPVTKVGKIAYGEIRKSLEEERASQKANTPEEALALAAKRVLGIDDLTGAEEFFKAGGDSHKILVFLVALQELGYELKLSDFATAATKEDVIAAMRKTDEDVRVTLPDAPTCPEAEAYLKAHGVPYEAVYPVTPAQEGILYHALTTRDHVYNVTVALRVLRPVQKDVFVRAARLTCEKYEAYNTVFLSLPEGTYAVVRRDLSHHVGTATSPTLSAYVDALREEGFDLTKEYGVRMSLVSTDDGEYVVYDTHHAVSDGISDFNALATLIRYYLTLESDPSAYEKLRSERTKTNFSYAAYLASLREKDEKKAIDFFLRDLDGYEDERYVLPAEKTNERGYATVKSELSKETEAAVRAFCAEKGYTLTMFSKAAWAILLHKYGYSEDIVFGDVASGRDEPVAGLTEAVGVFLNTVPNRFSVKGDDLVSSLLDRIRRKSLLYKAHGFLPTATVSSRLGRDVVNVLYNFHEDDGLSYGVGADTFVRCLLISDSNYPLELEVASQGRIGLTIEYDRSVYAASDMERMMRRLVRTYETLPAYFHETVSSFSPLTEDDEAFLSRINDTTVPYDENRTAIHRFIAQSKKTPDRVAVDFYDRALSYGDLDRLSSGFAAALSSRGIGKGDVVALYLDRSPEMIAAIYGVLRLGAVYLPLDETYPTERLSFVLRDSGAKLAVTDKRFPVLSFPVVDARNVRPTESRAPVCLGKDRAYIVYTSGTTGTPKGVVTLHKGLSNLLLSYEKVYSLTEKDVVLQVASYTFDQSVWDIFGVLALGGRLVPISGDDVRDPVRIAAVCKEKRVTIASFTPAIIAELDPNAFPTLRILDTSGEAANATVLRRWLPRVRVVNTYGPTEYTVNACSYDYEGKENDVPVGRPILNTRFYVAGLGGTKCGAHMQGELCIAGNGLSEGYLNRPDLNERSFPSLFGESKVYKTGDLVRFNENGDLVFIRRIDAQVKVRGYRIETGEVDAALRALGVKDCHVCVKKVAGDNALVAYVAGGTEGLREKLSETLPSYTLPQYFVTVDRIPRTLAGKADEKKLPSPVSVEERKTPPVTEREKALSSVWKELLQVNDACLEDEFFRVGGDSIKAIRLSAKLRGLGYDLTIRDVMERRTLREIAASMTPTDPVRVAAPQTDEAYAKKRFGDRVEKAYPLTPLQQGMLFHALRDEGSSEYLTQAILRIPNLDPTLCEKGLRLLFARLDVLRSAFILTEDGGEQIVLRDRRPEFSVVSDDVRAVAKRDLARGFDTENDVLFRVTFVRDGTENYLVQICHHLVADGWSNGIVFHTFLRYCDLLRQGKPFDELLLAAKEEARTSLSFETFVRHVLAKDAGRAKAHYEALLADFDGAYDYPSETAERPPLGVAEERRVTFPIAPETAARGLGTTEAALLETAWGVTLAARAGTRDAIFGNVLSGRNEPLDGIEELVGMLISTAPVRVRFDDSVTFRQLLRSMEKQNADNSEYGFVPLAGVAAKIGSVTVFKNFGDEKLLPEIVAYSDQTSFDVELDVQDETSYILRYNGDRYSSEEADRLCASFAEAILAVARTPDARVADLFVSNGAPVAPQTVLPAQPPRALSTERERILASHVSDVLGVRVDDANADFFLLGGDSIKAMRLSAKLRNAGYLLTVRSVMNDRTVAKMAPSMTEEDQTDGSLACGNVPSTPVVREFFRKEYPHPDAYVMEVALRFDASYDALRDALTALTAHHDLLRAYAVGTELFVPTADARAPLVPLDLRGDLSSCFRLLRKRISLNASLFAAARVQTDTGTYVCLCAHHLVMDGVSMRIVVEDVLTLLKGGTLPKKSMPYRTYALARKNVALSAREEDYLLALRGKEKTPFPDGVGARERHRVFSVSFTERFRLCGEFCSAKADDVLLTALARVLYALCGQEETTVLKESHGRSDAYDVTRTVGWFTSYYPLRVTGKGERAETLIKNKEKALAVPKNGLELPYSDVRVSPDVIFNFMGSYEEAGDVPVVLLPYEGKNPEKEKLDFEAEINDGALAVSMRFNGVQPAFCDALLRAYCDELTKLVDECRAHAPVKTPSDYGYPDMPLEDLNELLPRSPVRVAPLTPTQEGMLFHADDPEQYLEQTVARVAAPLDLGTAKRAFAYLAKKYDALRTHYALTKSGNLYQYVVEKPDFPVKETTDVEATAATRRKERVSPFDGTPVRVDYCGDVVIFTTHHVAFDLWSEDLLLRDLNAFLTGNGTSGPEQLSFTSYALGLRDAFTKADYEEWGRVLSGDAVSSLPRREKEYVSVEARLPRSDVAERFARSRGISLNVLMEGVTARFLQKACASREVRFAKAITGRNAKNDRAVGLFLAMLPVRADADTTDGLLDQLAEQASLSLRAPCSLDDISRRTGRSADFDVMMSFDNLRAEGSSSILSTHDRNHYGANITVTADGEGLSAQLELRARREEAQAYLDLFTDCYNEFLSLPRKSFPVLKGKTSTHPNTLNELFDLSRKDFFVVDESRIDGREIFRRAASLSAYLRTKAEKGVIAVCTEGPVNKLIAIYGVVLSGNAFMPVPPDDPPARKENMLRVSGAAFTVTDKFLSSFTYDDASYLATPDPSDAAYVLFTSGSTGTPKGVVISHKAIANRLVWMEKAYPLRGGAILQKTPYAFDVSMWEIFRPALFGGTLVTMRGAYFMPDAVATRLEEGRVSQVHFVPSSYEVFLDYCKGRSVAMPADVFLSGEKLTASLVKKHFAAFPDVRLHNLYGPTECAVDVTYYDVNGDEEDVPLGYPVDNVSLSVEYEGSVLPPFVEGELVIRGENVGVGYLGADRGGFVDGAYRTGDVGYVDGKGLLHFVGRRDDLVKRHGVRVSPAEIDDALRSIPEVTSSAVLATNEGLIAFFVGARAEIVQKELLARLPATHMPDRYVRVASVPLLSNGKADKNALLALLPAKRRTKASSPAARVLLEAAKAALGRDISVSESFADAGVSSLDRIRLAVKLAPLSYPFASVVQATNLNDLLSERPAPYFMRYARGNDKAIVCIPFAGGTGRLYESLIVPDYDVIAATTATFSPADLPKAVKELKTILASYKEAVVYAHCVGALTAIRLSESVPFALAVFGAHVPDAISSFFGRPVDGWKREKDGAILAALQKGGLTSPDPALTYFFRRDVKAASVLEAEKHVIHAPCVLLLAENDPFAVASVRVARARWKKLAAEPVLVRVLRGKNHYFVSDDDFGAILSSVLKGER